MHPIDLAPFWPGYEVVACRQSTHDTLLISLQPQAERLPICGRCAKPNLLIHEQQHIRQVRDRDLQDQRVLLQLPVRRVDCRYCGRVSERIDCLAPASRLPRKAACNTSLADLSGGVNRRRAKPCRSQLAGEWRMFASKLAPTERAVNSPLPQIPR
uniref:transposase family protein n=1 Tax=Metapseudomonas boanensis TaxID=2822138 RepID=UPI0032E8F3E8